MGDSGFIITGLFIMMIIIAVLAVVILVKLSGRSGYGGDMTALRRELREEIKRSRQETIETVGSSVRNLSDILSQNQREAVNVQKAQRSEPSAGRHIHGHRTETGKHKDLHGKQSIDDDRREQPPAHRNEEYRG